LRPTVDLRQVLGGSAADPPETARFSGRAARALRHLLFAMTLAWAVPAACETAPACPPAPQMPTAAQLQSLQRNARDHGFLWRIRKDGRDSYLYGTIHVGKPEWMFPGPRVMQALRATDTVALELDVSDPDIRERMAQGLAGQPAIALPEALQQRIVRQALAQCVAVDALSALSPEMQVTTLSMTLARQDGLDAAFGLDIALAGLGRGAGHDMVSLETPELQLAVLHMPSVPESIAFAQEGLEEIESGQARALLARIARGWADSDYGAMEHYDQWCQCQDSPIERAFLKRSLDDRNPGLADRIDELHRAGRQVFAAVGALHMFGPVALPTLMAKRGYQVERVELHSR
jgi:uncharacterized protein YbaP (TraB family)